MNKVKHPSFEEVRKAGRVKHYHRTQTTIMVTTEAHRRYMKDPRHWHWPPTEFMASIANLSEKHGALLHEAIWDGVKVCFVTSPAIEGLDGKMVSVVTEPEAEELIEDEERKRKFQRDLLTWHIQRLKFRAKQKARLAEAATMNG